MQPRINTNEHEIVYKELSYKIIKCVENINDVHRAQVINYLKATGLNKI